MNNQKSQQAARARAKAKVEFRIHLVVYIVVNALLAIINLTLAPTNLWFIWPLMGWGIGVFFHALRVYYSEGKSIKERMIEAEMEKENQIK